ncbi:hypothetical protein K438DRAFT_1010095 [Mycena galopus ATCC 62051]|nr:hypothetical protein K438DRAFT_1010095 [Mycena galopus ATCC 62051]
MLYFSLGLSLIGLSKPEPLLNLSFPNSKCVLVSITLHTSQICPIQRNESVNTYAFRPPVLSLDAPLKMFADCITRGVKRVETRDGRLYSIHFRLYRRTI